LRIKSIRIRNFRGFSDVTIPLEALTSFVGPNGAGKSTVLCALNMFFRESSNATSVETLTAEDFHHCNTAERIEIVLTFHELSETAKVTLRRFVHGDELVVSAVATFDEARHSARIRQFGTIRAHPAFAEFHRLFDQGAPANQLTEIFNNLRRTFPGIDPATNREGRALALRSYEGAHPDQCEPTEVEAVFYGPSAQSPIQDFVQWVYVPAVKDASDEQSEIKDSAFGKLLARTVRAQVDFRTELAELDRDMRARYENLLRARQGALDQVSRALTLRMADWSHPDASVSLSWEGLPSALKEPVARAQAKEGEFQGAISRFGHGFQRSYLMALLQELSGTGDTGPTLILGCEEPELYQHPPQARHLAYVLRMLAEQNAQILLTTHSPHFVSGERFESVRMVRRPAKATASSVRHMSFEAFGARYADADEARPERPSAVAVRLNEALRPHINELFFARGVVLVEGSEDAAYLMSWMALMEQLGAYRKTGLHIVPVDGKSHLARPLILAQELGIPVFVAFDADGDCEDKHRRGHLADNRRLLRLLNEPNASPFPDAIHWGRGFAVWPTCLSKMVDADLNSSLDPQEVEALREEARTKCGHVSAADKKTVFIQHVLAGAHHKGATSETLRRWCAAVLDLV
jgi:predicted ATP-dependent endonuclease of OLD family